MVEHATDDENRLDTVDPDDRPTLAAEIVVSRGEPAECTIFPLDASDFERVTRWITASEGSFVGLDEMR